MAERDGVGCLGNGGVTRGRLESAGAIGCPDWDVMIVSHSLVRR